MKYLYIIQQALVWILTIFWLYQLAVSICSLVKLKDKEIIKELLKKIINYTNSYENKTLLEIDTTKWI